MSRDVIDVDQDSLGKQGERVWASKANEIWVKPLKGGAIAVGLFNRGEEADTITFRFADVGVCVPRQSPGLWTGHDLGTLNGSLTAKAPQDGVLMLKLEHQNCPV